MITPDDALVLLAKAASVDNRKPSVVAAVAWAEVLTDLDLDECLDAIAEHRRNRPGEYLEPGHVRTIVKGWHADAIDRRKAVDHHRALEAVGWEHCASHQGYRHASAVLQTAIGEKYAARGEPVPETPRDPFRGRRRPQTSHARKTHVTGSAVPLVTVTSTPRETPCPPT